MKRLSIDELVLQIIFLAAGIYILVRIFIPILNPASIATNSNYNKNSFYFQILNKANSTIDIASNNDSQGASSITSVLFTYLTGIDFNNPITYISSQLPMLKFIDPANMSSNEQSPVVVVPREQMNPENPKSNEDEDEKDQANTKPPKKATQSEIPISTIKPTDVKVTKGKLVSSKPEVLILHSHTTESYNPNNLPNKNFSNDLNNTVARIGTALNYELENNYGVSTIHDSTIHDIPKRLGAYEKSRPTIQKYLKKYPSIKLVIDLHRDGEVDRNKYTAIINEEKYARIMLVAGIKFKNHEKYNKTSQKLESVFDYLFPGFSRGIDYKNSTYNQDLNANIVLIEVGTNENTMEEALKTTKVIAKAVAKYLE